MAWQRRNIARPEFSVPEVLAWADVHHQCTGRWPQVYSGPVRDGPLGEKWRNVDNALRYGLRGLPGGSSLTQLLAQHRGVRNTQDLPPLTEEQILAWAREHHRQTGAWPNHNSGPVQGHRGEVWRNVDMALVKGSRGLPGGASLARLLAGHLGVRNRANIPRLTPAQILAWADAHYERNGAWPKRRSGPLADAPGETWKAIDTALDQGCRGLPGGSSLRQLLAEHRGVGNRAGLPALNLGHVLAWARAHYRQTGAWPSHRSGPVLGGPGETWQGIDAALRRGRRGLPGRSSLARLLKEHPAGHPAADPAGSPAGA
jgi:hypothetical protein